jgi:hypothetical protein
MTAMRMFYLVLAVVIFIGIWLTGFDKAHWFLYVPVAMMLLAAATGWCTGMWLLKKMGFK